MKNFKKIMAVMIAAVMVFAMGITVFASTVDTTTTTSTVPTSQTIAQDSAADNDGKYTISVASTDTHTYTVYQILTGTLIAGQEKLGNPVWGSDAKGGNNDVNTFINAITAAGLSNVEINNLVEEQLKSDATGIGTVNKDSSMDVVPGYYLIKDTTTSLDDGDAYSLSIVAVFNDIEIKAKKGTTTSDKKVDDKNDSNTSEDAVEWQDSADYDIGDDVPFQLSATIAEDYANYTHGYKLTFHDKMEAGLTFNDDVTVYVGGTDDSNKITTGYTVSKDVTHGEGDAAVVDSFDVVFSDLKTIKSVTAGTKIYVKFTAKLNSNAVIGSAGNKNTSHITYTNNPNDDQAGENGKTPDDTVIVFTYKAVFDKYTTQDSVKKHLAGAEFTLYKVVEGITDDQVAALKETDVNLIKNTYTAVKSAGQYENETTEVADSVFTFNGIDDGTYVLVETKTPDGYNTAANLKFVVNATHDTNNANPALLTLTGNMQSGIVDAAKAAADATGNNLKTAEIVNNQGATLPSTGGIGTTIFYIIGGCVVLAAVIFLIVRSKKSSAK